MVGNCHGSDLVDVIICVFEVTRMSGGKGVDEMVNEK